MFHLYLIYSGIIVPTPTVIVYLQLSLIFKQLRIFLCQLFLFYVQTLNLYYRFSKERRISKDERLEDNKIRERLKANHMPLWRKELIERKTKGPVVILS